MTKKLISLFVLIILLTPFSFIFATYDNFQISNSFGTASDLDMVWTGANYGFIWADSRSTSESEIYFVKLNELGGKASKELKISSSVDKISDQPTLIWSSNGYAAIWSEYSKDEAINSKDGCDLYFTKIDKDANAYGGIISITSDNYGTCPSHSSIAWTGNEYGVIWHETRAGNETSQIFFIRLNPLGVRQGQEIQISQEPYSKNPSIVWDGSEYGLVWQGGGAIYFAKIDASGNKIGSDIKISETSNVSSFPKIVWRDSYFFIIWQGYDQNGYRQIYFAKLNKDGNKLLGDIVVTSNKKNTDYSLYPSIVWSNNELGLSWQQNTSTINFITIDADGNKNSVITEISNEDVVRPVRPIIASGTSQYGFGWIDSRSAGAEIYFAKLGFSNIARNNGQSLLAYIQSFTNNWLIVILFLLMIVLGMVYAIKVKQV